MKYPFSPAMLDAMPEKVAEIFRSLELALLDEICSRLNLADALNEVTLQDIRVLRSHGIDLSEIKEAIKKSTAIGEEKLNAVIDDAVERNKAYYGEAATLADVTIPQMLLSDADIDTIRRQTNNEYTNITQSMGFLVDSGRTMLPPAKAYQWAIDNAAIQIQSGGISYNEAIKNAVKQLADSGIKTVDYESGHVDHVDVAVRRAVMTAVNQLNRRYEEQAMEYLQTDLVEVSAHQGARDIDGPMGWENHKAWQGKVYRWKQYPQSSKKEYPDFEETCGYGDVTGILGANCRHSFAPFIEGVSERTYTDEQLAKIDPQPFEYEGRTYTAYEATQMQRRVERTIRKLQREETAYTASGNKTDAQLVHIRKNRLIAKYHEFSAKAGLPEQPERMKVYEKNKKILENASGSGIIKPTSNSVSLLNQELAGDEVPLNVRDDYSDFEELYLSQTEFETFDTLFNLSKQNKYEYGCVYKNGVPGDTYTSGFSDKIKVSDRIIDDAEYRLYHSHTNATLPSKADFWYLLDDRVSAIGVISSNRDCFIVEKTEDSIIVTEQEFYQITEEIEEQVNFDMIEYPEFQSWTIRERQYMAIREQAYRISRKFGWKMKGGKI